MEKALQINSIKEETLLEDSADSERSFVPALIRAFTGLEDGLMVLALGLMLALPLAESLLRKIFGTGIIGSAAFVQHLVLYVGMLGGAIAARKSRLLAISIVTNYLKGRWESTATIYVRSYTVVITLYLALASLQFILAKVKVGDTLIQGIPLWPVLLISGRHGGWRHNQGRRAVGR